MRYDPAEQARIADPKVVAGFLKAAAELGANERLRLALFAAGIVEANLKNPTGGDLDSVGSLQQRAGWGPVKARMNPYLAALAFIRDAQRRVLPEHPEVSAGRLAQLVQRSKFPDRYGEAEQAAAHIIRRATEGETVATWRLAPSLAKLFDEINETWPKRSKAIDGTIGDKAHAARKSEHNPDEGKASTGDSGLPTVDAIDVTSRDIDADAVIARLIKDPRVWYVIHKGRIWSRTYDFKPRKYTGANPHTSHIHISINPDEKSENSRASWKIAAAAPAPTKTTPAKPKPAGHEPGSRPLKRGDTGEDVATLQRFIGFDLEPDGEFGPATEKAVRMWHKLRGRQMTGEVTMRDWRDILEAMATT